MEDEGVLWLMEKIKKPTIFHRIGKSINTPQRDKSELNTMHTKIIEEFKPLFMNHIQETTSGTLPHLIIGECFEERIRTLPDDVVSDIFDDYLKYKEMESETGRDIVRNYILNRIEMSYSLDDWFLEKIFGQK